ncbi:MAG: ABC transporter permease [Saprospiraceae bacterium]
MYQNYFRIAFRNLIKNRLYTALNICGLAIGVTACMLILLFVAQDLNWDRWNPLAERIVRPTYEIRIDKFNENHGSVDALVGPEAAEALPEIQAWCRIRNGGHWDARLDGQTVQNKLEEKVLLVDSSFFKIFPLKVIAGNANQCLSQPGMVALSRSRAIHYFKVAEKALGQTLILGKTGQSHQVTAVFEDIPAHTHFHADLLLPLTGNEEVKNTAPYWGYNNQFFTYFLLQKGVNKASFAKKFKSLASQKVSLLLKDLFATSTAEFERSGQRARFDLQNLTDIHLYSAKQSELEANGNIRYVWIFGAIAFFILLIACINFMNLSTARSAGRAREVGVRKVLGSSRMALAGQFLMESVLLSAFSIALAVGLTAAALPDFCALAGRELFIPWSSLVFWSCLLGGTIGVGLLAGIYPAFFLSAFNSIKILKGARLGASEGKASFFRNGLVVFQFAVSTALIVSTFLVYNQLQFMQQKNLGFDKSQVLLVDNANVLGDQVNVLKAGMLQNTLVESATRTNYLPMPDRYRENCILSPKRANSDADKVLQRWRVDADYVRTLGMEIKSGRDFDPARLTDSTAILINETAARELGFTDPIGQKLYTSRTKAVNSKSEDFEELTIIGVLRDFHFESMHQNIGGLCLQLGNTSGALSLRIKPQNAAAVIADLEQKWQTMMPNSPLEYHFMDETLNRIYASEQRIGLIAFIFAVLSILVSCLGLFGLAAFTAEQRIKEIGVRKVLGASVGSVVALLSKDFLKLVLLAIVIGSPLAYYFMQQWLSDFAYRIDIQANVFIAAALVAAVIAFLTVGGQSLRAALTNPVESLRSE